MATNQKSMRREKGCDFGSYVQNVYRKIIIQTIKSQSQESMWSIKKSFFTQKK